MEEKGTFQWELVRTKWMLDEQTMERLGVLSNHIRNSKRIKPHIAQMDDLEIAEYYHLIDENALTNLGVLWLGNAKQRSSICYPITVQYIVYDHSEKKVRKEEWHDNFIITHIKMKKIRNCIVIIIQCFSKDNIKTFIWIEILLF